MRLPPATLHARLLLAATLSLTGCNLLEKEQPPAPVILYLSLDDSLSRYDSVTVHIADGADTGREIQRVWAGALPTPSQVPPCTLTGSKDNFLVKVRAYRGKGQLGVETYIYYEGGRKRVVHNALPPLVPFNWLARLTPSTGILEPVFNPDVLGYSLPLAANVASVSFDVVAAYTGKALVVVGDQTVAPGVPPKAFPVDTADFTVPITVTDLGTTRLYQVMVVPPKPLKVELSRMELSAGATMVPAFKPETEIYNITIPSTLGSVDITCWPADPVSMTLVVLGEPTFAGSAKRIVLDRPGATTVVTIGVSRGGDHKEYTVFVARAAK